VESSDRIDCDCGHLDYTCGAINLHVGDTRVQDTEKFVDQRVGCRCLGVNVKDATHTVTKFAVPRLGSFLSGLQLSVTGISQNVSYLLWIKNTNSKYG